MIKEQIAVAELIHSRIINGEIELLLPQNYSKSTIQQAIFVTKDFNGSSGVQKIINKFTISFIILFVLTFTLSPLRWYLNVVLLIIAAFFIHKVQAKAIRRCLESTAMRSASGLYLVWSTKLAALKVNGDDSVFINGHDSLEDVLSKCK